MPAPRQLTPGLSPLHWFGAEFRRARETAGMSQGGFGATVPCDTATVSRVEGGELTPSPAFIEATTRTFPGLDFLVRFLEAAQEWGDHGPMPKWFDEWLRAEGTARVLRYWQPIIIPGILQSADYARTLLRGGHVDAPDEHIESLVAARLDRRAIFDKTTPPDVMIVIDEIVLRRLVGSPKIMHAQLTELADLSERPRVSIQIVPAGYGYGGTSGPLNIASGEGMTDVLHMDALEGQTTERRALVHHATITFDRIRGDALPRGQSRDFILRLADEIWNT
jgi:hypothetical protein